MTTPAAVTAVPDTATPQLAAPAADTARALRDQAVRLGWALVEAAERTEPELSKRLHRDHLKAQADHARATLAPLKPWPASPERVLRVMNNPPNQVRMRRLLDLVRPDDRILDVGAGYGYLSGVLQRDGRPSAYTGIDLGSHQLASVEQMREVNGLTAVPCRLEVKDLYDLTPDWVAETDPDLLVLLEVLEHVPDAERALGTVARCLRPDAAVVFSVPVLGRLEACWGHVSLFDTIRLRRMITAAGLVVQHVEVVYDTWTLVVASPGAAVLPRVVQIASRPAPTPPLPPAAVPAFLSVELAHATPSSWNQRTRSVQVSKDRDGLHCTVTGSRDTSGGQYGGVRFPLPGDLALRLELQTESPRAIRKFYVEFSDARGRRVSRWVWDCAGQRGSKDAPFTVVLRPGLPSGSFHPSGASSGERAVAADVFVEIAPKAEARFTVRRAAAVQAAGR